MKRKLKSVRICDQVFEKYRQRLQTEQTQTQGCISPKHHKPVVFKIDL